MLFTHLQFPHLDLNWIVCQGDLTKYLFLQKELEPFMDNVLKFVVFDTDSCLSQWKLLLVTNFLFDLIHCHNLENLVMTSLFNSFYLNNKLSKLLHNIFNNILIIIIKL